MKAIEFINKRFNSAKHMPRSVRIMRMVAGIGVAVAVIAIVLAQSIGNGFERVYRKSLLDFNAHVVIMGGGEIEDPAPALAELAELRSEEGDGDGSGWFLSGARAIESEWLSACDLHEDYAYLFDPGGIADKVYSALDPHHLSSLVPNWITERYRRRVGAAERALINENVFLYREALIIGSGSIKGVVVKGIEPGKIGSVGGMKVDLFSDAVKVEERVRRLKENVIPVLMGRTLATSIGIGDVQGTVRMLIPREDAGSATEKFEDVEVVGTFESGMHDYDSQFVLMNIDDARNIFGAGNKTVTGIELRVTDPDLAELVAGAAERILGPRYRAITWQELNADLIAAVKLEKLVTSLIMAIMLLVAALNIIAALVLTTIHRMREIAVLKALGLSDKRIERLFVRGGLDVGMSGVVAGLVLGLAASIIIKKFKVIPLEAEIYLVDSLPIDISWLICGIITLFCAVAIYLTSRIAASRLATVPPAEGLAQAR